MEKRIALDPEAYAKPMPATIRGVAVEVFVSPYDVPTGVVGDYRPEVDRFVIDFRYPVMDEPSEVGGQDGPLTFHVGEHSQRLFRIDVDVKRVRADFVSLRVRVEQGIERLASANRPERQRRADNYRIARKVIEERGDEIFQPLLSS